jgi:hypothetical protein
LSATKIHDALGSVATVRSMCPAKSALVSRHSSSVRPSQADLHSDAFVARTGEGPEDDRGAPPELRGGGEGVAEGAADLVLTFGDDDLGRFARHEESTPGDRTAREGGQL